MVWFLPSAGQAVDGLILGGAVIVGAAVGAFVTPFLARMLKNPWLVVGAKILAGLILAVVLPGKLKLAGIGFVGNAITDAMGVAGISLPFIGAATA